jgi:hypothetical protein
MKLIKFLKAIFIFIYRGDTVNEELYKQRLSLCNSCDYREDKKCGVCGCSIKLKTKWTSETCPKNKW